MPTNKLYNNNKIKLLFASEMDYGNYGDLLSRYIIEKLTGAVVENTITGKNMPFT